MRYEIVRTEDNEVVVEASRINDKRFIQEVRRFAAHGCFADDIAKIFRNGEEIEAAFVIDGDDKAFEKWFAKKSETHKLISVSTGVCCFKQNERKIWVRK